MSLRTSKKRNWIIAAGIAAVGLAILFLTTGGVSSRRQRLPDGSIVTFKRIERSRSYTFPDGTSKWKLMVYDYLPEMLVNKLGITTQTVSNNNAALLIFRMSSPVSGPAVAGAVISDDLGNQYDIGLQSWVIVSSNICEFAIPVPLTSHLATEYRVKFNFYNPDQNTNFPVQFKIRDRISSRAAPWPVQTLPQSGTNGDYTLVLKDLKSARIPSGRLVDGQTSSNLEIDAHLSILKKGKPDTLWFMLVTVLDEDGNAYTISPGRNVVKDDGEHLTFPATFSPRETRKFRFTLATGFADTNGPSERDLEILATPSPAK